MNLLPHFFLNRTSALLCVLIFAVCLPNIVSAQKAGSSTRAGVQRNAEKGLKDNRYFLYYINYTITNNSTDEEKKKFEDIVRRDILSQFFYLRFIFTDSYTHIRLAQKDLIDLYRQKIADETVQAKALTDGFAGLAINKGDAKSRLYLRLSYRELTYSRIEATMADNYKPKLYSMRLYKYVRSLKHLKEAKRYAFLARIWLDLSENEKIKDKILTFDELKAKIEAFSTPEEKDLFLLMHYDSYYRCPSGVSLFDKVWEKPDLDNYPPFVEYRKSGI